MKYLFYFFAMLTVTFFLLILSIFAIIVGDVLIGTVGVLLSFANLVVSYKFFNMFTEYLQNYLVVKITRKMIREGK